MSTDLLDMKTVQFARFFGGKTRGRCYTITIDHGCDGHSVELTELEMAAIVQAYRGSMVGEYNPEALKEKS